MKRTIFYMLLGGISMTLSAQPIEHAYFAGGCFWCMEAAFEKVPGVTNVVSGYMGGSAQNPTYQNYADSGHIETIDVSYNPKQTSYKKLLDVFWRNINPTDAGGQFVDRGPQYRSVIFYENEMQKKEAEASKKALEKSKRFDTPVVTELKKATPFYNAEEYHQEYYKKHPWKYWWYRSRSGRDEFLQKHWGNSATNSQKYKKPSNAELRKKLTPLQYRVTQGGATELPFKNTYWDNTQPGIYVDIVSGEPLFSSKDQFKSGTGWPSFSKPLVPENIIEKSRWLTSAKEVRSKYADSHLGDVFKDGPPPTGLRYCLNSAALRFIPAQDLEKEGYGQFKAFFEK